MKSSSVLSWVLDQTLVLRLLSQTFRLTELDLTQFPDVHLDKEWTPEKNGRSKKSWNYTVSQKSRPLSLSTVRQILTTDFQNSFTDTLCGKPVIMLSPPHSDQIFEWRSKNILLQFFPEVAQNSLRIPRVFHVQRNPRVFQVFQVCGHPVW